MTSVPSIRGWLMPAALSCMLASILASAPAFAQSADGSAVFTEGTTPSCGICHVLDAAGTSGEIGPNLDELKPDKERVARAVRNGVGNMPAFAGALTDEQIAAVSRFVATSTGAQTQ